MARTLRRVADRFDNATSDPLRDPALDTPVEPDVAAADLAHAASTFSRLADLADVAVASNDCQAAVKWREILGGNDRALYVFPLPPGCDAIGNRVAPVIWPASQHPLKAPRFG